MIGLLGQGISRLHAQSSSETIEIDPHAASTPFPHFWEETFGSGRAILTLRDSYRSDLREMKKATDVRYVRFHALLHDEVGAYDEDDKSKPIYNFSYVDQNYDGLLKIGVRPFVEISFMPKKLAARQAIHPFWYAQNVAPPKDYAKWDDLMTALAQHLVERYGIDEVAQWYFEVWNEPNIDFWQGEPKQPTYFELYSHTARALKAVSPRLRVGGPASAAADWVEPFLAFCAKENVPVDFVSSHGYADDTVENLFHTQEDIPMDDRVCRAIGRVKGQIRASFKPDLPLMWTEWNVPSFAAKNARDTIYVGPALAKDIHDCDGLVNMMSYWTFDDVFEETGVVQDPFHGGFGTIAAGSIKKPAYFDFSLLHMLGEQRLANPAPDALVTKRKDGTLVVAVWNLVDPDAKGGEKRIHLQFQGAKKGARVAVSRVDATHGNTLAAYEAMGKPRYPTQTQIEKLNEAGTLPKPEEKTLKGGALDLDLGENALVIVEVR